MDNRTSLKGVSSLRKKLEKLKNLDKTKYKNMVDNLGARIRDEARNNLDRNGSTNTSELKQSIQYRTEIGTNEWTTEIYTAKEYAPYVELGTGPRGQRDHAGISPNVNPIYSPEGWLIPADDFPNYAEYGYKPISIKGIEFIPSLGQPAKPFLYPAANDNRDKIEKFIVKQTRKIIRDRIK